MAIPIGQLFLRPAFTKRSKTTKDILDALVAAIKAFPGSTVEWTHVHLRCFQLASVIKRDSHSKLLAGWTALRIEVLDAVRNKGKCVMNLVGSEADAFLSLMQMLLDVCTDASPEMPIFLDTMIALATKTGTIPRVLFIDSPTGRSKHPVGAGGFGDVWRANWKGKPVALKSVRHSLLLADKDKMFRNLLREVLLWRQLRHPHLLQLIGVHNDKGLSMLPLIVSEWMESGNVLQYMNGQKNPASKEYLLSQVASALDYLHTREPPVIHQDLRCSNILIDGECRALLSDFGLSRLDSDYFHSLTSALEDGNVRWRAPELLFPRADGRPLPTRKSDIWSFGMLMLELFTERAPFTNIACDAAVIIDLYHGKKPERPESDGPFVKTRGGVNDRLWSIIEKCWADDPEDRPSASLLAFALKTDLEVMRQGLRQSRLTVSTFSAGASSVSIQLSAELSVHFEESRSWARRLSGELGSIQCQFMDIPQAHFDAIFGSQPNIVAMLEGLHNVNISFITDTAGSHRLTITGIMEGTQNAQKEMTKLVEFYKRFGHVLKKEE
ncbi:hypothetical protein M0805_009151 [Coniferiporia weirii]|nr:hypothetical protein M0805_009151 [Coniferiporia weirii]